MRNNLTKIAKVFATIAITLMVAIPQMGLADVIINSFWFGTAPAATFYVVDGSYSATGSALSVTGMPCAPVLLILKSDGTGADEDPYISWNGLLDAGSSQAGARSLPVKATDTVNISSYNSDGFTIQADAGVGSGFTNKSGQTVYYMALCGDTTEIKTGQYTGNATDNRNITGVGFDPDFVIIKRVSTTVDFVMAFAGQGLNEAFQLGATASAGANTLQDIITDGFQVGTSGIVNANTAVYNYIAVKIPSGAGNCGSYTGNSTDNTDITITSSIQPEGVFIKGNAAVDPVMRTNTNSGDNTSLLANSLANGANRIQALNSNGFQVGTNGAVNTSATTYWYCAMKDE